ncbi:MAG: pyridoxal phosphate-dependent aminotransferase [Deltaproteobacteria bacterium]|nr:MAG: pyridoxal phosphate-dependent aminotransferase [Deltaproteobacteria bacterium]
MTLWKLSSRLSRVQPSITMAVTAKAAALRAQGIDVIGFGAGEPDFDTPDHIKDAARRALDEGVAGYTHVAGLASLREAIATELNATHGTDFTADHVIVTTGAKQSLFNLFMCLLDDGDEVIVPAPYWVSYPDMVRLAGGEPVIVPTTASDGFQLDPDAFAAAIGPRTRAVVLNTPSNPTGALYSRDRLEAIAGVAIDRGVLIVSDDIYRSLVYGDAVYASVASLGPEVAAQTILVDGVSKTYAMTGWRIGYTAANPRLIGAMAKLQGQSTSNATHIAQVAALAAITGPREPVEAMRRAFDERRRAMVERLNAIDGVRCTEPLGAFYAFPDLSAFLGRRTPDGTAIEDDVALAAYLVDAGRIAVVPGSGFGAPGYARLSYATSMDHIQRGLDRMAEALGALR